MKADLFGDGTLIDIKSTPPKPVQFSIYKIIVFEHDIGGNNFGLEKLDVTKQSDKKLFFENQYHHPVWKRDIDSGLKSPVYTYSTDLNDVLRLCQEIAANEIKVLENRVQCDLDRIKSFTETNTKILKILDSKLKENIDGRDGASIN